jgi:hypothetical protein
MSGNGVTLSRYIYKTNYIVDLDDVMRSADWLKNNCEPFESVLAHWKKSFQLRKKFSSPNPNNDPITISSIYDDWPILKLSTGYLLVML